MSSDWQELTLKDIAEPKGGLVDGPFGSNLPASCYVEKGVPVIRGSNLTVGLERFKSNDFVYVSNETLVRIKRSECLPNDIVFTKKGTLGQTGIVPSDSRYEKYLLSSNQMRLRVNTNLADPGYVYYWVSSNASVEKIKRDSEFTGVPKINLDYLKKFPIVIPKLTVQKKISKILSGFDNIIELNRQTNQTLEAISQAIFKSWFVDFEPVKAKISAIEAGEDAEGVTRAAMSAISGKTDEELDQLQAKYPEQYAQLKTTAELFPSSIQDSELGEVPEGWKFKPFGELLSNTVGGDWGKDEPDSKHTEKVLILRGTDLPKVYSGEDSSVPVRYVESKKLSTRKLQSGDIVIEISGGSKDQPTGRSLYLTKELLQRLDSVVEPASFCRLFRPINIEIGLMLGLHLMKIYEEGKTWYYQNQSTGISNFQTKVFLEKEEILLPRPELINYFYNQVAPLIQKIHSSENLNLSAIRDALLPKLLSGELSVDSAEFAEEN